MCKRLICSVSLVLVLSLLGRSTAEGVDPNLVGWWNFDGNANDSSGYSHNGTEYGGPTYVAAPTYAANLPFYADNNAISLAGTTAAQQYVDLPIGDVISKLTDCSFALWVNYRQTGGGNRWQRIFDFGTSTTNYMSLRPRRSSSAPTHFEINVGGTVQRVSYGPYSSAGTTIPTYTWVHIAVTIDDANNTFRLYVNGRQVGMTSGSDATFAPIDVGVTAMNWLGRSIDPAVEGPYFPGYLDDFRVYNRTLSADEVKQAMGYPVASFPTPGNDTSFPTGTIVLFQETTTVDLKWVKGASATSVNGSRVYFGDSLQDVTNGAGGADKGPTSGTTYTATDLVLGKVYYWRVDTAGETGVQPGVVWSFMIQPKTAYESTPPDDAMYVAPKAPLRWRPGSGATGHNLYLSDNLDQVNNAPVGSKTAPFRAFLAPTADPNWTLAGSGVALGFNKTYYWRVDEIESPAVTHKGQVWRFTTVPNPPPVSEPNLVGWWKFDGDLSDSSYGCDGTVYGGTTYDAGFFNTAIYLDNANDSDVDNDMYVSLPIGSVISSLTRSTFAIWVDFIGTESSRTNQRFFSFGTSPANSMYLAPRVSASAPTHFQIASGGVSQMVGYGANAANAGSMIPANEWHHLAVTISDPNSAGTRTFTLYLDGVQVGVNTAAILTPSNLGLTTDNWLGRAQAPAQERPYRGYLDDFRIYDRVLSEAEIKQLMVRLTATDLSPRHRATGVSDTANLRWIAGDKAVQHDVYFGTDPNAVANADRTIAGIYRGRQTSTSYTPTEAPLEWNMTYYWRIDEVNDPDPQSPWQGNVWSFTVADYLIVDDFEDYTDDVGNRIFQAWLDGLGYTEPAPGNPGNGTGSVVGYAQPPFAELTFVHSGRQSMPLGYDNSGASGKALYSETMREWASPQDWTRKGVKALTLWFRGIAASVGSFNRNTATGVYTLTADGTDIWDTADQFHFAFKRLSGTGTIEARVLSVSNTDPWAKSGVMIRETLDPGSAFAAVYITPANGCRYQARLAAGQIATSDTAVTQLVNILAPHWIKLERTISGRFNAYDSNDPATEGWHPLAWNPQVITMQTDVYVGLALTGHNVNATCVAEFSNVATTGTVTDQWQSQDIGIVSNTADQLYLAVQDGAAKVAVAKHQDPNAVLLDSWQEWNIDLKEFGNTGVNLRNIKKMYIGVGDRVNPQKGGTGSLYIDDIRLYTPRCIASLLKPAADISGNCVVDFADLDIIANEWLDTGDTLTADLDANKKVDLRDYAELAGDWLSELLWPQP